MQKFKILKPIHIFIIFVVYVFVFFGWWTFLHFQSINEKYNIQMKYVQTVIECEQSPNTNIKNSTDYQTANAKLIHERIMISIEGLFFLIILAFGVVKIYRDFKKEELFAQQQQNFMLSITHELRSPIAGIQLVLQTLLRRNIDRDKQIKLIGNSIADSERLKTLVENILMASKLEGKSIVFIKNEINLSALLEELLEKLISEHGNLRNFTYQIRPSIYIQGDVVALTSIINNLIENAVKYSPENADIKITLLDENDKTKLTITDTGIGIPDAEKNKIFEKFYRIGSENTRKTQGTGLGLYIVKQLVTTHNATIKVADNQPKGTIFTIEFAISQTATIENYL